jgi:RHS repeat-associated protein
VLEYDGANDTTTVVNHLQYSSFGQITSQTESSYEPRHTYTGREWDADVDLYYYRARWYDAAVGRFISEDPIGFAAGDANIQRYVGNEVLTLKDPSGLQGAGSTATPHIRPLTMSERRTIEYLFTAAMPSDFKDENTRVGLAKQLSRIQVIPYRLIGEPNPIPNAAIGIGHFPATTVDTLQYYRWDSWPEPDSRYGLPLLCHETVHSYHVEVGVNQGSFLCFSLNYALSGTYALVNGEHPYYAIETEVMAYAMGSTAKELLRDPVFRKAAVDGTVWQPDLKYRTKVSLLYG